MNQEQTDHQQAVFFLYNPKKSGEFDIEKFREGFETRGYAEEPWRTSLKEIGEGIRFYLIQTGEGERGIIGAGYTIGKTEEGLHWEPEKKELGETARYVKIRFDELYEKPLISSDELNNPPLNIKVPRNSGARVPEDSVAQLNALWNERSPWWQESEREFAEGQKIMRTHLETERNRKVVNHYFKNSQNPRLCDICQTEVANKYPWKCSDLIEVHHILPLSSSLYANDSSTSMSDLVGLCRNCHKATHDYYTNWLSDRNITDFKSKEHAKEVYSQMKSQFSSP